MAAPFNNTHPLGIHVRVPDRCHSSVRSAGGKSEIAPNLGRLAKWEIHEFREPFASSAAMTFFMIRNRRAERFWLNDLDPDVANYHQVTQQQSAALVAELLGLLNSFGRCSRDLFDYACRMVESEDRVEAAAGFYVRNRLARSGTNGMSGYNLSYEDAENRGLKRVDINRLWQFSEWLQGVRITNLDYREVMDEPGDNVFALLDPPYESVGKTMYAFGEADLKELAERVHNSKHACLVTVDDSPSNRILFSDMRPIVRSYASTMGSHHAASELICANYTTPLYAIHARDMGEMLDQPSVPMPANDGVSVATSAAIAFPAPAEEWNPARLFMQKGNEQKNCEWYTPDWLLQHLYAANANQPFDLDPCSPSKGDDAPVWAHQHFTVADDGLAQEWHGRVWLNPPYHSLGQWVEKAADAVWCRDMPNAPTQESAQREKPLCETVVGIIPARTHRRYWREFVSEHARVFFITGAVGFSKGIDGKRVSVTTRLPEGLAIVVWGNHTPFTDYLRQIPRSIIDIYERSAAVIPDHPVRYWDAIKKEAA